MDKDEFEFKNSVCTCVHIRDYHAGTDRRCCVEGCKCKQFVKIEGIKIDRI